MDAELVGSWRRAPTLVFCRELEMNKFLNPRIDNHLEGFSRRQ